MVSRLTAAVARCLLDLDHIAFLAEGGAWDEVRFPRRAGGPGWAYRLVASGVRVDASPAGEGLVPWAALAAIADAGMTAESAQRARALARLTWETPTPARLGRADLAADAGREDTDQAGRAVVRDVVDAGIARCGGEQLDMFDGAA